MKYNEEDIVEINMPRNMWEHAIKQINDNDYYFFCDNHPSHGHNKECPISVILGDK